MNKRLFPLILLLIFIISSTATAVQPRMLRSTDRGENEDPPVLKPLGADYDTTLGYTIGDLGAFYWIIPNETDDKWYNVRFAPPESGNAITLLEMHVLLYTITGVEGFGTPGMNVRIWQSRTDEFDPIGLPGEMIEEFEVDHEDLIFNTDESNELEMTVIDLRDHQISFNDSTDFHIGVDCLADSTIDTLAVYADFRDELDHSSLWDGLEDAWAHTVQIPVFFNGATRNHRFNFAIRCVLEVDDAVWSSDGGEFFPNIAMIDPAYPNPFNGEVNVGFSVKPGTRYSARLYDNLGRHVRDLEAGVSTGKMALTVNAQGLNTGVYYFRLFTSEGSAVSQPLIHMK